MAGGSVRPKSQRKAAEQAFFGFGAVFFGERYCRAGGRGV